MQRRELPIVSLVVLLTAFVGYSATADDAGLPVPAEEAQVDVLGRVFMLTSVDAELARQKTEELEKRAGSLDLTSCRVMRAVESGRLNAPVFFLGMCQGALFNDHSGQTNYCLNTGSSDFEVNQSHPDPHTPRELIRNLENCVLETCADNSCD